MVDELMRYYKGEEEEEEEEYIAMGYVHRLLISSIPAVAFS